MSRLKAVLFACFAGAIAACTPTGNPQAPRSTIIFPTATPTAAASTAPTAVASASAAPTASAAPSSAPSSAPSAGATATPTPSPTPTAVPSGTPVIAVSPNPIDLSSNSACTAYPTTEPVTASESGYSGNFSATSEDTSIFTVSPATSSGTFTVTANPSAFGSGSSLLVADTRGNSVMVPVSVAICLP